MLVLLKKIKNFLNMKHKTKFFIKIYKIAI